MTKQAAGFFKSHDGRAWTFAFLALILISLTSMVSYFAYDAIGPLENKMKVELGYSSAQVQSMFFFYSIAVILFVVAGGVLADKLGVRKSAIIFSVAMAVGCLLVSKGEFAYMAIGRMIFGLSAEAFYVVQNKILAKWFKKKALATAFGLNLFVNRAGSWAAYNFIPNISEGHTAKQVLLLIAVVSFVGMLTALIYSLVDAIGEKNDYIDIHEEELEEEEVIKLRDVFRLPKAFWVISLLCMTYYSAIFPFINVSNAFLMERYGFTSSEAGDLIDSIFLISMFTTFLWGIVIDRIGKRASLMIFGAVLLIPCHVSMAYTDIPPIIPIAVLGFSFSLVPGALWPAIPLIIKERLLGTGYGVVGMIQNIGLGLFPVLAGLINDKMGSYRPAMIMFSALGFLGLIFAIWLKVIEKKAGGYLDQADVS